MVAAISYAVETDLRAEFSSCGFPISNYWYERLIDNTENPPDEDDEAVTENSTAPVELPAASVELAFTGNHAATTINAIKYNCKPSTFGNLPAGIETISSERYWRIASSAGNVGTFNMTFDLTGMTIFNISDLTVLRRNNYTSEWENLEDLGALKNYEGNSIVFTGIPYFSTGRAEAESEYVPAGGGNSLLPVTLASFTATLQEAIPILQWVTLSEINNSGWNVFRNTEDNSYNSLQINPALIAGAGSSTETANYQLEDQYDIVSGLTYYYWLESVSYGGDTENYGPIVLKIPIIDGNETPEVPLTYGLLGNYPNPFNPSTSISFRIDQPARVSLTVYNLKGQLIKNLLDQEFDESQVDQLINIQWDGTDNAQNQTASGIYLSVFKYNGKIETGKMILIK
jgi:hypothetical protein